MCPGIQLNETVLEDYFVFSPTSFSWCSSESFSWYNAVQTEIGNAKVSSIIVSLALTSISRAIIASCWRGERVDISTGQGAIDECSSATSPVFPCQARNAVFDVANLLTITVHEDLPGSNRALFY